MLLLRLFYKKDGLCKFDAVTNVQSQILPKLVYEPSIGTGPAALNRVTDSITAKCVQFRPIEVKKFAAMSGEKRCCKGSQMRVKEIQCIFKGIFFFCGYFV